MTLTIGSLFSGYGGLTGAVETVTGGHTVWHCDNDPAASKLLAHRYPGVPNLGDITAVDWATVEPVDIIDGGSPCQDVSSAGKRAGMRAGTRSGLWASMVEAIDTIRPRLVVWENVRGVLSAEADSALEPCPGCVGDGDDGPVLRALGRVLGDLADIGYDASWHGLRAADIGAPHGRFRVFVVAWPADSESVGREPRRAAPGRARGSHDQPDRRGGAHVADTDGAGLEVGRAGGPRSERPLALGAADAAADTHGDALRQQPVGIGGRGGATVAGLAGGDAAADTHDGGQRGIGRFDAVESDTDRRGGPHGVRGGGEPAASTADASSHGRDEGWTEPAGFVGRPDAAERGDDAVAWGGYEPAIRRWERVTRPAPLPWEQGSRGGYRLAPAFSEWMMGVPAGWVTDVPGLSRNDQLKLLGNGVVPQQGAAGITRALDAAPAWVRAGLRERAAA